MSALFPAWRLHVRPQWAAGTCVCLVSKSGQELTDTQLVWYQYTYIEAPSLVQCRRHTLSLYVNNNVTLVLLK